MYAHNTSSAVHRIRYFLIKDADFNEIGNECIVQYSTKNSEVIWINGAVALHFIKKEKGSLQLVLI